ncbi:tyrosine-type recombinase/integrase [Pseudonocardia sp. N23]|uniref:tyrosine-type recombinase/integrase n=1 Tax=Pseudonocardia sp. N23 TaxID=1987376 RepID=UPI000BFB56D2|nr:tyrosine-type recombinase/integrase [Pseudonocardia sp. N23]GAY12626.1 phage integrase family protein [Pseudonocardia sp. N23]
MDTSYDVKIWKTEVYTGTRKTTYRVRWTVGGHPFKESYSTSALADSVRSDLVTAARRGEAFDVESGQPVSVIRNDRKVSWFDFAREYSAMKWPHLAPNSRRNTARALTNVTLALLTTDRGRPDDQVLRKTLTAWAFNHRADPAEATDEVQSALTWLSRSTRNVGDLGQPTVVRTALDALTRKADKTTAAPATIQRQRGVLVNVGEYAVERGLLSRNPVTALAWKAPRTVKSVDKRVVVNPDQARGLLDAVRTQKPSGKRLVAFFGALYFAGLRPAEAATLRTSNLSLPAEGWGELLLEASTPSAGASWTDSGQRREERQLKHRARGETRVVPCAPELVALLREHLDAFGNGPDGLLFRGLRGGQLSESTYCRVWRKARVDALGKDEAKTPLARRPYDLRHAAVSTWLNAGVPATQVAEWAGHSVAVLLQIYAKSMAGQEDAARQRIATALGGQTLARIGREQSENAGSDRTQPDSTGADE